MKTLYLIDASGFIFRAFYALPPLSRPDGVPVGAVYGFCNMLFKLREMIVKKEAQEEPLWGAVFDVARKNFRHEIDPEYKNNRKETPPELAPQFALIREASIAFHCPVIEQSGFEADDVIATLARQANEKNIKVVIVSSDKDLMQLYRPGVEIFDPMKQIWITSEHIQQKFGVDASQVIDVQSLAGDASDGIKGVPGIGIKTAAELIKQFGSLEVLLSNVYTIPQKKRQALLTQYADNARTAKKLVSLRQDIEIYFKDYDLSFPSHMSNDVKRQMLNFFEKQGFAGLIRRVGVIQSEPVALPPSNIPQGEEVTLFIKNMEDWHASAEFLKNSHLNLNMALIRYPKKGGAVQADGVVIAVQHANKNYRFVLQMPQMEEQQIMNDLLDRHHVTAYDIKALWRVIQRSCDHPNQFDDVQLIAYALLGGQLPSSYQELCEKFLNCMPETTFENEDQYVVQAVAEAAALSMLKETLSKQLDAIPPLKKVYQEIDKPTLWTVYAMEQNGVYIDISKLQEIAHYLDTSISDLEVLIYSLAGKTFNLASPQQLGKVLFEDLQIPFIKKSKTGQYQTDSIVLSEIIAHQDIPIINLILKWRKLFKLRSTYIDSLIDNVHTETKRIHSTFLLTNTNTGRLASLQPNLQNIPIRTSEGEKIREAFVGEGENYLASFDYSQIELRLLAYIGKVSGLIHAFEEQVDIHRTTAAKIFHQSLDDVNEDLRRKAKTINFGIIYGQSGYGLAQQLKISNKEANDIIKAYFKTYPEIESYIDFYKDFARKHGYVETLFKRRCYIPNINNKNFNVRQFAERQAINAPLQGSNADIIKIAMTKIHKELNDQPIRMVLQIHDELIFEGTKEALERWSHRIQTMMENVLQEENIMNIPLVVNYKIAKNWAEAH